MAHVIFKITQKSVGLLNSLFDVKNAFIGLVRNLTSTYVPTDNVLTRTHVYTYIYTHTHIYSDMILASPLQILHPEVLYSMEQFRDSRKSFCLHSKCIVGVHSNLVSEFHQAVPCLAAPSHPHKSCQTLCRQSESLCGGSI